MPSPAPPLSTDADAHSLVHSLVHAFLQRAGYASTLAAFEAEALQVSGWRPISRDAPSKAVSEGGITPPAGGSGVGDVDLRTLAEAYLSNLRAAASQRQSTSSRLSTSAPSPLDLILPGPPSLPYTVTKTFSTLHSSNILSLSLATLPSRRFDTSTASYRTDLSPCLVSSSADKRIVFTRLSHGGRRGEVVESLEEDREKAHSAAVLCTAQSKSFQGELVSSGMDARVVVWDLLSRQPVQTLSDHSKFVVRLAFSQRGRYLASCSYDRSIRLYKRRPSSSSTATLEEEEEDKDEQDVGPPLPPRPTGFELCYTLPTDANPEAILFVRAPVPGLPTQRAKRTWLAYTVRGDCFLHYLLLPRDAEEDDDDDEEEEEIENRLAQLEFEDKGGEAGRGDGEKELQTLREGAEEDWSLHSFNTNATKEDLHVSYSLLSLSLHPLGTHISVQTGDHTTPQVGHSSSAPPTISRILLLPLLSSERTAVLWTSTPSSSYSIPRHAWNPRGDGVWCTSEEGVLRLVDTTGKVRATVAAHGAAVEARRRAREGRIRESGRAGREEGEGEELRRAASWSRGGNTIIRDVVVLTPQTKMASEASASAGEGEEGGAELVASCGFDRTVRIIGFEEEEEEQEGEERGQARTGVSGTI